MAPETRYARSSDGTNIAYHVVGEGDLDLVFVPTFISNIELGWELPKVSAFLGALAERVRLILFDRRGCGASDGPAGSATLETQLDDVRAVLDETGSRQPALMSLNEGCALALLFAASHPEVVSALVMLAPQARLVAGPGYEWALSEASRERQMRRVIAHWGRDSHENPWMVFSEDDPESRRRLARYQRLACGPGDAEHALRIAGQSDAREVLGSVQCPTLVLRRAEDRFIDARHARYIADRVPGARLLELPGGGPPWVAGPEETAEEIAAFIGAARPPAPSERLLATVLFTDIVSSTERAAEIGDGRWRELLQRHDSVVRDAVERHRGRVVKSLGDGALAVFDGPSRALGAALAIRESLRPLGLVVRAGVHTGECELIGEDIGGLAVHIGARIAARAAPEQVLASRTVRDLSIGSPFALSDTGEHELKGIGEPWQLFSVESAAVAG
jgi:class 3 adenylate cyclase